MFHSKIHILQTLLHLSALSEKEKSRYDRVLNHMIGYSTDRNVLAHDLFTSSTTNDGVQFLVVRAKGKIQVPDYDWNIAKFETEYANLDRYKENVHELASKISKIRASLAALMAAATALPVPTGEPTLLSGLGRLSRQPQEHHMSETTTANPETDPQTPPSQQE